MKKTKLFSLATVAVLSSTIPIGETVLADEETTGSQAREVETEGSVGFRAPEDGEEEIVVNPPEETEPPVTIPPTEPGSTGPLTIAFVPTLNFGERAISNEDRDYSVLSERQVLVDDDGNPSEETTAYVSFAQVQDTRGNNAGWTLTAHMTDFVNDGENVKHNVLKGAQVTFKDPSLRYASDPESAPSIHSNDLVLIPGAGTALPVMTADTGKGAGVSSVVWGDQTKLNELEDAAETEEAKKLIENEAIVLSVPGKTIKDQGSYISTITWELTTAVENN